MSELNAVSVLGTDYTPEALKNQQPQRPEHVPEKFWKDGKVDTDGLAKSYTELQGAFSKVTASNTPVTPNEPDKSGLGIPKPPEKKGNDGGFNWSDEQVTNWTKEYEQNQKLSEKTYKEIGLPRPLVDSWIAGQEALKASTRNASFSLVGGEDNYSAMTTWARDNLAAEDRDAYNRAVTVGDSSTRKMAIEGLYALYQKNEGSPAQRQIHGTGGGDTATAFRSPDEMVAAMKDKRYKTDPAYNAEVAARTMAMK